MVDATISEPLIDALYEYNAPLWEIWLGGYNPPQPEAPKKTAYARRLIRRRRNKGHYKEK